MKVFVIGVGMGNVDTLTVGAKRAIEESDVLVGAERLLEPFGQLPCEKVSCILPDDIASALAERANTSNCAQASVLMSGDVGFYSGATKLYERLGEYEVEVVPGISSVQYFCAKLRTTWQDATLVSAHGREHNAVGVIQSHEKTFCITGGKTKAEDICRELAERGLGDVQIAAGERLSYEDERIVRGTAAELASVQFANLTVLLAENPHPVKRPYAAPSLSDMDFQRGNAPMTKEEVRALSISKLRIQPNHTVWDVGAGTGSVSVEAALAACEGRVFAVEKKPDAIALLEQTREQQGAWNMHVVAGEAPSVLADLPAPDRVFIGGSSGNLAEIVQCALNANPLARICVTAVTIETLSETMDCAKRFAFENVDIVQVSIARGDSIGRYHLMRAENPVYIVTLSSSVRDAF